MIPLSGAQHEQELPGTPNDGAPSCGAVKMELLAAVCVEGFVELLLILTFACSHACTVRPLLLKF